MPHPKDTIGDPIPEPHRHDVLSGRGNFVNNHPGNEHFRSLVRMHKVAYVATPKSQKPKFSRLIFDAIKNLDPPGRFLKQGDDASDKMWYEITEKKALDKTRQALREGAPEIRNILEDGTEAPVGAPQQQQQMAPPPNQRQQEQDEMAVQMEQQIQAQLLQLQQIQQTQQQLQHMQQQVAEGHQRQASGVLGDHQRRVSAGQGGSAYPNPCLSNALQGFGGQGASIDNWNQQAAFNNQAQFMNNDRMQMPPPSSYSRPTPTQSYPVPGYPDSTLPLAGGGGGGDRFGMTTQKLGAGSNGNSSGYSGNSYLGGQNKGRRVLQREDSVQLGDILLSDDEEDGSDAAKDSAQNDEPEGKRRNSAVQMSMGMSFSLGDIDSGLSKMLEDSLDLDGNGGAGGYFTHGQRSTRTALPSVTSSSLATSHGTSAGLSGPIASRSTGSSKLLGSTGRADSGKVGGGDGGESNQMSFSQLIDFNESYQTSFKSNK